MPAHLCGYSCQLTLALQHAPEPGDLPQCHVLLTGFGIAPVYVETGNHLGWRSGGEATRGSANAIVDQ